MTNRPKGGDSPAATVRRYINGFNALDEVEMAECFAPSGHILDGMAPHVWSGATATQDWFKDAMAEADHLGVTGYDISLGQPIHDNVTGDAAYFVAPATLGLNIQGHEVTQSGAIFTIALRRVEDRWLIAAWAWSKGPAVAAE